MPMVARRSFLWRRNIFRETSNRPGFVLPRSLHASTGYSSFSTSRKSLLLVSFAAVGASSAVYVMYSVLRDRSHTTPAHCEDGTRTTDEKSNETPVNLHSDSCTIKLPNASSLNSAIQESSVYVSQLREETGAPGLVVAVSIDGALVWNEGFGYADVENNVKCTPKAVMRIASISKALTATVVAKLYEEKKVDLDAPVQKYIPTFPQKAYKGEPVTITTRQLLSHLGGIRHYKKPNRTDTTDKEDETSKARKKDKNEMPTTEEDKENEEENRDKDKNIGNKAAELSSKKKGENKNKRNEFENEEFYIKDPKTLVESIALFKDDPLVARPGEDFKYTSHGYTLVSGVVQAAAKEDFVSHMKKFFRDLGMKSTAAEYHDRITYNRARHYVRGKKHGLTNAPYVNNSYKWAGGGFTSTAEDLVRFGNAMLYARQTQNSPQQPPGILKPETVAEMWAVVKATKGKIWRDEKEGWYGWGWYVVPEKSIYGCGRHQKLSISHAGGAVGGVSVLLLQPDNRPTTTDDSPPPPRGIVVALIMNQQEVSRSVSDAAREIAAIFDEHLNPPTNPRK